MTANCLNCDQALTGKYCAGCGQKSDTHRISLKNFVFHDLLHGTFHIERGMLFTAKQALLRPGHAALEYISGKRKRYYNVFLLILLTIGVMLFFRHVDEFFGGQIGEKARQMPYLNDASRRMDQLFVQNSKMILLLFIPFGAINGLILFGRKKLNFSEHSIVSGMILLGILLIGTIANILFSVTSIVGTAAVAISYLLAATFVLYISYGYYNAFARDYSRRGICFRIILFFALLCIEIALLFAVLVGYVTYWKYDTAVQIMPFR